MKRCLFLAVILVACLVLNAPLAFAIDFENATSAVLDADTSLREAFMSVNDAERTGANVSELIARLAEAGDQLTGANSALNSGDYSGAVSLAGSCKDLANSVIDEAVALKTDAVTKASEWWIPVSLSIISSAVLVAILFLVWHWFKRFYQNRLLESKPEMVT